MIVPSLGTAIAGEAVAYTNEGRRVLETAGAPTYYFPPNDVNQALVRVTGASFHCGWKGRSQVVDIGGVRDAGWMLSAVYPEFAELYGWFAFYPQRLACYIEQERAGAQPGGYYGGWVTRDLAGPIKGGPSSRGWWSLRKACGERAPVRRSPHS